ncbi:cat eye syndrome critical region protein 1 [Trichodelitschia bisporula]|uniref:adenosine deaminase n=1 Tax=Trichodelitschia bisporula TaxID=703511 RepID=A0A6G1HRJ4_9PEZI|nr:cat eye syndrome critical region protein 1 [Trichodelitschia bisporula]
MERIKSSDEMAAHRAERAKLLKKERDMAWDKPVRERATAIEQQAALIIWKVREHERDVDFGNQASEAIPGPETLDLGGQFLTNRDRIERSRLFKIAQELPKGAHLHLHFNAELPAVILLQKAKDVPNMFVRSTEPLVQDENYATSEIVFNVMSVSTTPRVDIFSATYKPAFRGDGVQPWMLWSDFRVQFRERNKHSKSHCYGDAEEWVLHKMILDQEAVYGLSQTTNGIWARFNQATRCFKGLMNYESVYSWYIGEAIDNMIRDRVMYAELRPMLLDKQIPGNDGKKMLDHRAQMQIIIDQVTEKKKELGAKGELHKFPFGLKIIYCAPRSIPKPMMQREIVDCIKLKLEYDDLICGFDLVGAEDRANHIGFYQEELVAMQQTCHDLGISIPFMFHAGESLLDTGGSKNPENSNLYDSVLFEAKRIGHGFSLLKHPVLVEEFKKKNICVELCPTSNELLHLCRNVKEHPYPEILAAGIPCTINSDNPSLFTNSVSHEFYQVMVGSMSMSLYGWRQLVNWSIQYSCLSKPEQEQAKQILEKEWVTFCHFVVDTYGKEFADKEFQDIPYFVRSEPS